MAKARLGTYHLGVLGSRDGVQVATYRMFRPVCFELKHKVSCGELLGTGRYSRAKSENHA